MRNAKKLHRKNDEGMETTELNEKDVIENEINYLISILYKLSKAINEREKDITDHKDPELQSIYIDDIKALTTDFTMIVEQINLRLEMYVEYCNKNHIPIELDYFRLYKILKNFIGE